MGEVVLGSVEGGFGECGEGFGQVNFFAGGV